MSSAASDAVLRADGRGPADLRPLTIVYEGLARADGSARFGFGPAQALTSVSGPLEARPAQELPAHATLDVLVRPLAGAPGTDARALAATLRLVLAPSVLLARCPRTLVQLVVQALCEPGAGAGVGMGKRRAGWSKAMVASALNSASLALLSAGVPMRGVVCAVAVGRAPRVPGDAQPALVLDPSDAEAPLTSAGGCFAFLFSAAFPPAADADPHARPGEPPGHLVWTDWRGAEGAFGEEELARARELARGGARAVWRAMRESVPRMDKAVRVDAPAAVKSERAALVEDSEGEVDDEKMEIA